MWAGCTSGRRVQGSLPGTVCTALGPLFIFPWEHRMALMGVSFSLWVWVASACTLPSEPDIWPWAGLLVWRGLQERQQAWAQRLCWVLHSRSGPSHSCSQASEIWVLPRGHQGWWGPSVMGVGGGGGGWPLYFCVRGEIPLVKLSLWVCECWLSLPYSHNCRRANFVAKGFGVTLG